MITGYNTDVRHREVVFHVQTEDKGAANPFIESLVYVGGQVLASKRANYADLLAEGGDEKEIVALMDHQHRTMIAAIRHGKFDGKLATLVPSRPKTSQVPVIELPAADGGLQPQPAGAAGAPPTRSGAMPAMSRPPTAAMPVIARPPSGGVPVVAAPPAASAPLNSRAPGAGVPMAPRTPTAAMPIVTRPPTAAVPVVARAPAAERTLDQVILEYLTNEADQEQLVLVLEGEADLALGRRASLALRTSSSKSGMPVAGVQVSVRMISTIAEPRVLAVGRTDEQGGLPLRFEIPPLDRGTAALIISAVSAIGRAELKHLL
jgi:hypothetical protein